MHACASVAHGLVQCSAIHIGAKILKAKITPSWCKDFKSQDHSIMVQRIETMCSADQVRAVARELMLKVSLQGNVC
jgi:hypothetical protein